MPDVTSNMLEPEHRPYDPFDGPMILLNDIVEVLVLAQIDVAAMLGAGQVYSLAV